MTRRIVAALVATAVAASPACTSAAASVFDIPAIVPPKFRSSVRAHLHMPKPRRQFVSRFDIDARRGYRLSVIAEGNRVALEIGRPPRKRNAHESLAARLDRAVTAYVTRGVVTPNRIAASFGRLGSVDMRFRPSGRVVESHFRHHCRGPDHVTSLLGVFVGNLRFHGEKRFVSVRAHRAKGSVRSPLQLRCSGRRGRFASRSRRARPIRPHPSAVPTFLEVGRRHAVDSTELLAFNAGKATLLLAVDEQSLGTMAEVRYAVSFAPGKALTANEALTAATLKPPAPFHGQGDYRATPEGARSWSGSLSVAFPGAPRLRLTGDGFKPQLGAGF